MSALRKIILSIFICLVIMGSAITSWAIPTLQLDIGGGTYDLSTETIVSSDDTFTLYAYLIPDSKNLVSDTYYISMAVTPKAGPSSANLGSISFAGSTINVTSDMAYGTAPFETYISSDPGDLAKHGIFETYYYEDGFQFDSNQTTLQYNTQDDPGGPNSSGTPTMYYMSFLVDASSLDSEYNVHFDLYNTKLKGVDTDITQFAPFSHDAESRHNVPEPMTLILLGLGLLGLGSMRRKFKA